ncbi:WXG100 family type VII secretion target [Actinopolyspora mzabensis]|uniref:WXG100 family type VII secretion target n=1 Tax=Actinopolyspora mzabensis TaxID=995066 RepID=UPI00115FC4F1|nr:PPE domain-containing protein [Actinopolyspora mzabensis]
MDREADGTSIEGGARADRSGADVEDVPDSELRPEGVDPGRIHEWFHHAPGTDSMDRAAESWSRVAAEHGEAAERIDAAIDGIGAAWSGTAAEAVRDRGMRARVAADDSAELAERAGEALRAQSFGFNEAKKQVVEVSGHSPATGHSSAPGVAERGDPGAVVDESATMEENRLANQTALRNYGVRTTENTHVVPRPAESSWESAAAWGTATAGETGTARDTEPAWGAGPASTGPTAPDSGDTGESGARTGFGGEVSGAHLAAGAAGLAATGGAVLGGGVLGERMTGRGGISGRGFPGFPGSAAHERDDDTEQPAPDRVTEDEDPDELFAAAPGAVPAVLGLLPAAEREPAAE